MKQSLQHLFGALALALAGIPRVAFAQSDAGLDAADATSAEAGPTELRPCNITSGFDGDDRCILPPQQGFQLHYGPAHYDDPVAVGAFMVSPGDEVERCYFLKTPNTATVYSRELHFRARPGVFEGAAWMLPTGRPDSTVPETCGEALGAGAAPLLSVRRLDADLRTGAPENEGLAWAIPPNAQVALQVHSRNPSVQPLLEEMWLNVVSADASSVVQAVGGVALRARGPEVAPGTTGQQGFACAAPEELRLVQLVGDISTTVQQLSVHVRRSNGTRELVYASYDSFGPPVLRYDSVTVNPAPDPVTHRSGGFSGVLLLHPGDVLEWDCRVDNPTSATLRFGSGSIYDGLTCDVHGVVVRSNGTAWTCVDDREPPDAGAGTGGALGSGAGGRSGTADAGLGGAGGADSAGSPGAGGEQPSSPRDGGGDGGSAAAARDDGGCGCRLASPVGPDASRALAAWLALLLLGGRRRRADAIGRTFARRHRIGATRLLGLVGIGCALLGACSRDGKDEASGPRAFSQQTDDNCDGTPDSCYVRSCDAMGNATGGGADADCDGKPDGSCSIATYDAMGNATSGGTDTDCDGKPDSGCSTSTYDAMGNLTSDGTDVDCDGTLDLDCYTSTYDAMGNLTSGGTDADCDGTPDRCYTSIYDAMGNETSFGLDADCDGTLDLGCRTSTYDENGNQTSQEYNDGCDGTPDRCYTWTYDENGNRTSQEFDDGCDGTPDPCVTLTYDEMGHPARWESDSGCDGTLDRCGTLSYDEDGNQTSTMSDEGCDGTSTLDACSTWTYDENGKKTSHEDDGGCDGSADTCTLWTYDADGSLTSQKTDTSCDGTPDSGCTTFTLTYGAVLPDETPGKTRQNACSPSG